MHCQPFPLRGFHACILLMFAPNIYMYVCMDVCVYIYDYIMCVRS